MAAILSRPQCIQCSLLDNDYSTTVIKADNFSWRQHSKDNHIDHSGYGLSQWETTLHCNVVSIDWAHNQNEPCTIRSSVSLKNSILSCCCYLSSFVIGDRFLIVTTPNFQWSFWIFGRWMTGSWPHNVIFKFITIKTVDVKLCLKNKFECC